MDRGLWRATVYGVTDLTLTVFHINHSVLQQQDIACTIVEGGFLLRRFMWLIIPSKAHRPLKPFF